MSSRYSSKKRSGSYSSYSGYKKKRYSSTVSRARNQIKAAKKGNDSLSFVINSNHVFSAKYNPNGEQGVACVNIWEVLARNSNFNLMKQMYDQIRIDAIQYRLNITNAQTTIANINEVNNYTIYTAWDKTGLSPSQYVVYTADGNGGWKELHTTDFGKSPAGLWRTSIGKGIVNNSSAKKSILSSFQRWNSYGSIYPHLLNEKSQYVQTSDIELFSFEYNQKKECYELQERYTDETMNDILASPNPVIPFESTSCRFKPCLLVGVFSNQVNEENITPYGPVPGAVVFNGEFSISCTFRNLKGTSYVTNPTPTPQPTPQPTPVIPNNHVTVNFDEAFLNWVMNNPDVINDQQQSIVNMDNMNVWDVNDDNGNLYHFVENPNQVAQIQQYGKTWATSMQIKLPAQKTLGPTTVGGVAFDGNDNILDGNPANDPAYVPPNDEIPFVDFDPAQPIEENLLPGPENGQDDQPIVPVNPNTNTRSAKTIRTLASLRSGSFGASKVEVEPGNIAIVKEESDNGDIVLTAVKNESDKSIFLTVVDNAVYTIKAIASVITDMQNIIVFCWNVYRFLKYTGILRNKNGTQTEKTETIIKPIKAGDDDMDTDGDDDEELIYSYLMNIPILTAEDLVLQGVGATTQNEYLTVPLDKALVLSHELYQVDNNINKNKLVKKSISEINEINKNKTVTFNINLKN